MHNFDILACYICVVWLVPKGNNPILGTGSNEETLGLHSNSKELDFKHTVYEKLSYRILMK